MSAGQKKNYGNESITSLKGADRVRLRPAVIFGSDGLEGCQHSFFEILSNSIDEAREGYGKLIRVIRHKDHSITVEDQGRGIPWTIIRKNSGITGSLFIASCMPEGNTPIIPARIMNMLWV